MITGVLMETHWFKMKCGAADASWDHFPPRKGLDLLIHSWLNIFNQSPFLSKSVVITDTHPCGLYLCWRFVPLPTLCPSPDGLGRVEQ